MATRKNGNGNGKQTTANQENIEMVIDAPQVATDALETPIQTPISWSEAVGLSGTLSPSHLQEILCQKLSTREPKIWGSVPLEHQELLASIKVELTNAPKQLSEASQPVLEVPLITDLAVAEEAPKHLAKKRGRPSKAEIAERNKSKNAEAIEAVENLSTARKEHQEKLSANTQAVTDFEIQQEALSELVTRTRKAQARFNVTQQFDNAEIGDRIEALDKRHDELSDQLATLKKYQTRTEDQTEKLKQESVDLAQQNADFFNLKPKGWEEAEDLSEW